MMDEFMYQQELQRWYGRTSVAEVDAAGNTSVARPGAISSSLTGLSGTQSSSIVTVMVY